MRHALYSLLIGLVFLSLSPVIDAADPTDTVKRFAGQYSERFLNEDVNGEKFWSENVVEIEPISPEEAYFSVHLEFYNGHLCDLGGVAQAKGSNLVFHDPQLPKCILQISRKGDELLLNELDEEYDGCKNYYCGMRGGFNGITLPWRSRRPITDMQRQKNASEYQETIKKWKQQTGAGHQDNAASRDASPTPTAQANCSKAQTASEKAICANPKLQTLDRALAQAYHQAFVRTAAKSPARQELIQAQRAWIKELNACDGDTSCLQQAYQKRIQELSDPGQPGAARSGNP